MKKPTSTPFIVQMKKSIFFFLQSFLTDHSLPPKKKFSLIFFSKKFFVDIKSGAGANDYKRIAKVEHLNELEKNMRMAIDRAVEIRSEQKYLRNREAIFRGKSEDIYSRVMWWSLSQVFILLITAFIQVRYLKNFFAKKKVV